jgi:predicted nucleotidyltransferase
MDKPDLKAMRQAYQRKLEAALDLLTDQLSRLPEVRLVVLFGSYATGRRDLFTDLDLLVVMKSDQDFVTRTARLYQRLHPGVDMDLVVYTPEEFESMRENNVFVRQAIRDGKILYEKISD